MKRAWLTLAIALGASCLGLAACGDAGGWQGTVTDSAGVEIVTNTGTGSWRAGDTWTVEQDLMIGTAEGDPEYQFGQIAGIDVGSDGRLYVLDQQAREVRVFDPEGDFVVAMGQAGSGPGELSQAAGPVFVSPGDTVVVPDMMQQRITLYTAAGEPAGTHPLPMTGGIAVKWMETPDQELIQQAMIMAFPNQPDVEPKTLLLRRRPTGEVVDTVLELPIGETVDLSGNAPAFTLFEGEPVWTVGPDGRVYAGFNSEYSVREYSPTGDLVQIIRKPRERTPITESDQAEYRRVVRELWQQQGVPPEALDQLSQQLQFAEFYPAFANILGGPEGTLWVQGIQTPDEVQEQGGTFNIQDLGSATWEVFNREGRLLGTVTMPPRFTPLMFLDDALYGVLRDELDVQYAVRMVVHRAPAVGE
jgi:hypothetical protein